MQRRARDTAEKTLRTYTNYAEAFRLCSESTSTLALEQDRLLAPLKTQKPEDPKRIAAHAQRGYLCLKAICVPEAEHAPELVVVASHWAAIQAYYAFHGLGWAVLSSLRITYSKRHDVFAHRIRDRVLGSLMPRPFSIKCRGGPQGAKDARHVEFIGSAVSAHEVRQTPNLATPTSQNAEKLVCKALQTTRSSVVEGLCDDKRLPGKRLPRGAKAKEERGLAETSFVDFLWRMRCRANYQDPEMFIFAATDRSLGRRYCQSVKGTATTACRLLWRILQHALPAADMPSVPGFETT